jgi:hypothetical protein
MIFTGALIKAPTQATSRILDIPKGNKNSEIIPANAFPDPYPNPKDKNSNI